MKFIQATLVFGVIGFVLSWGILAMIQPDGKPWLLLAGAAAYLVLFWRKGCAGQH